MKIGFLMGSFDPIHIGHVNMIREALNFVDKVIVVPSGHNPWKKDIEPAPFNLRVEMISQAIIPFGKLAEVSDIEGTFEPPYFANKPLNYFREKYKDDELYIICGSDTADKIRYWKDASTDILPFYKIISLERQNPGMHTSGNDWQTRKIESTDGKTYEYKHVFIHPFIISSTYLRRLIKENKIVFPLLPQGILELITIHKLYME